uniref:Uncharacterized protein n=1 Tax=Glossina austeni TaxID=7395 RepID=A0A1A9VIJ2_GLOAU
MFSLDHLSQIDIKRKSTQWMKSPDVLYGRSLSDMAYNAYVKNITSHNWLGFLNEVLFSNIIDADRRADYYPYSFCSYCYYCVKREQKSISDRGSNNSEKRKHQ